MTFDKTVKILSIKKPKLQIYTLEFMIFIHPISLIALIEQGKKMDRINVINLSQNASSCNVEHFLHTKKLSKSSEYCTNDGHLRSVFL